MKNLLKQLISFSLPVTVLVVVPLLIGKNIAKINLLTFLLGFVIMLTGLFIMVKTIWSFIIIGKGTLAPWSPPAKLITGGLYAHLRNPMIVGVLTVLTGEAIAFLSLKIAIWAAVFFVLNNAFFFLFEEPDLERRFGNEYREYKKNVPRWVPRLKAFKPDP